MKRRDFVGGLGVVALPMTAPATQSPARGQRPNIVLIVTDNQGRSF